MMQMESTLIDVTEDGTAVVAASRDVPAITQGLVNRLAAQLECSSDDIDVTMPFSAYGLDSVAAVALSGDLQDWLGVKLPPTLTWDYPTIELLAEFLATVA
jgi:acyl carrier protein